LGGIKQTAGAGGKRGGEGGGKGGKGGGGEEDRGGRKRPGVRSAVDIARVSKAIVRGEQMSGPSITRSLPAVVKSAPGVVLAGSKGEPKPSPSG